MKSSYLFPFYRHVTSKYNFDDYASKGSTVYPVRKYHRNMHALEGAAPPYQPPAIAQGQLLQLIITGPLCKHRMIFSAAKMMNFHLKKFDIFPQT